MARQMVGQRKPALVVAIHAGEGDGKPPDASDSRDGSDDATNGETPDECPNCGCQFDPQTGDVVKQGAKVVGEKPGQGYQGKELDTLDSAEPTPGKMGTAADAARGDSVMGDLLANLRGGMR